MSPINGQPLPEGPKFEAGEEARENGRKGGKRSGEVRRARKTLREELLDLLTVKVADKNTGKKMPTQKAISAALIRQAMFGNTKAYEVIRDTIGEKPTENMNLTINDYSALEKAFSGISGGDSDD